MYVLYIIQELIFRPCHLPAAIAQLGERQTEDLKVPGSIPGLGIFSFCFFQPRILSFFLEPYAM